LSNEHTDGWIVVTGKKCYSNKLTVTKENITALHNVYSILSVSNDPTIESNDKEHIIVHLTQLAKAVKSTKQKRLQQRDRRKHVKNTLRRLQESEELFFDESIARAENEPTTMAKEDTSKAQYKSISTAHILGKINRIATNTSILQRGQSTLCSIGSGIKQMVKRATGAKYVSFKGDTQVCIIHS
jgi:hypothetical protein